MFATILARNYKLRYHMELKPLDLPFGNNFILSLRDELFDMEAVSRIFEEDIDIVNEVQRHIKNGSDMALPSTLYLLAKDGYNLQHDTLGLRYYLTILCSLLSHDDNSSKDIAKEMDEAYSVIDEAPQSNIHAEVKSTCYIDDSDSEIFRVKRRSYKATAQKTINFVPSKPEHQMTGLDHLEPHVEKKRTRIVFEVLGSIELASYLNVSSYKTIDG
ncbi:hypothetical protein Tco_0709679 [Tanacetum coccineum]